MDDEPHGRAHEFSNLAVQMVTRQDIEDIITTNLAPLHLHVQTIERNLGALIRYSDLSRQISEDSSALHKQNVDDTSRDTDGPLFNEDGSRRGSSGSSIGGEGMGNLDSLGSVGTDVNPKGSMMGNAPSKLPRSVDNLIFRNELAKVGVSEKKEISQQMLNTILWAHAWISRLEDEPARSGRIANVVTSNSFDTCCICVIFVNSFHVAYSADWSMNNIGKDKPAWFPQVEIFFTFYFALELFLRMFTHRLYFFTNKDKVWNWFDCFLVTLSLMDFVVTMIMGTGGGNVSFMRILRLMKLSKILRAFRTLKFFKELAVMMDSFRRSFVTLFWSLVMIGFVLFVFALIFLQGLADTINAEHEDMSEEDKEGVLKKFGSMRLSVLSLYQAVTGGDDWGNTYSLVMVAGPFYGGVFLLFTFFFILALFNILTGAIVEKAVESAAPDRQDLVMSQRKKLQEDTKEFKRMCELMDTDGNGLISWPEFQAMTNNEAFMTYMASVGLEVHDVELFFKTIVGAADDALSIDQFVQGCMHMRGGATAIDLQKIIFETHKMQLTTSRFQTETRVNIKRVEKMIRTILNRPAIAHLDSFGGSSESSNRNFAPVAAPVTSRSNSKSMPLELQEKVNGQCELDGGSIIDSLAKVPFSRERTQSDRNVEKPWHLQEAERGVFVFNGIRLGGSDAPSGTSLAL